MNGRVFVLGVSILPLSAILIFVLGIVPTLWYVFHFIIKTNVFTSTLVIGDRSRLGCPVQGSQFLLADQAVLFRVLGFSQQIWLSCLEFLVSLSRFGFSVQGSWFLLADQVVLFRVLGFSQHISCLGFLVSCPHRLTVSDVH